MLTITTFLSLDGVMQAPGAPTEDTTGNFDLGGWVHPHVDAAMGEAITGIFAKGEAYLLGRRTYEIFAGHWPRVTEPDNVVATKLNGLPKYVVSKSLKTADWKNSTIVRDLAGEIEGIKSKVKGELQVHGSCGLAQALIAKDLIDQYNLFFFPVVLGKGRRLFGEGTIPGGMKLLSSTTSSTGVIMATYRRDGAPKLGSFELPKD